MLLQESQTATLLDQLFSRSKEAVFATDGRHRIVYQNPAFTQMLQCPTALGRPCHEVLQGRTLAGDRFCSADCSVGRDLACGRAVDSFDLVVPCQNRQLLWLSVGGFAVPQAVDRATAIFVLRPVNALQTAMGVPGATPGSQDDARPDAVSLTRREREILRLLAGGSGTEAIARALHISHVTVRRHTQNLFAKLGVHSRVEAVGYAYRHHLV